MAVTAKVAVDPTAIDWLVGLHVITGDELHRQDGDWNWSPIRPGS
jgi:hypothetical protein